MDRRAFITLIGSAIAGRPLTARAQQPRKVARILRKDSEWAVVAVLVVSYFHSTSFGAG